MRFCLLVMAKSPVPGRVKTRLCPPLSPEEAADVAAASLLDTLEAALETPGAVPVVALAGVVRREDVREALAECVVIPQRGETFGDRLANAHADIARFRVPVLQIGMDTPQVTPSLLESCAEFGEAALGFAADGGWWALGLRDPLRADVLRDVPMSRADTGVLTLEALRRGRSVGDGVPAGIGAVAGTGMAAGTEVLKAPGRTEASAGTGMAAGAGATAGTEVLKAPGRTEASAGTGMAAGAGATAGTEVLTPPCRTGAPTPPARTDVPAPGLAVRMLPVLSDVDTITDAHSVAAQVPHSRFAAALASAAAVTR